MGRRGLPRIPPAHEIARSAVRTLVARLPPAWTAGEQKQGDDYGIDLTLGIAEDGEFTGRNAHLQVKGVQLDRGAKIPSKMKLTVKRSTLCLLQQVSDAAAVVIVDITSESVWFANAFDRSIAEAIASKPSGKVVVTLREHHKVTFDALFYLLNKLSYRKAWRGQPDRAIAMRSPSQEFAVRVLSQLQALLPTNFRFAMEDDPTVQFTLLSGPDGQLRFVDLALPYELLLPRADSFSDLLCGLIAFCQFAGLGPLAARLLAASVRRLERTLLFEDVLSSVLIEECTPAEQSEIIRCALEEGREWGREWMLCAFVNCREFSITPDQVIAAFGPKELLSPQDRFQIAQILRALGASSDAKTRLRECIATGDFPQTATELYHVGRFFELEGESRDAASWYEQAGRFTGTPPLVNIRRAVVALAIGDFDGARSLLPSSEGLDPYSTSLWFLCTTAIGLHKMSVEAGNVDLSFFSSPSATENAYESAKARAQSGDAAAIKLIIAICSVQALRSNSSEWWARLLVWSDALVETPYMDGNVLGYASVEHGADPLRLAAAMVRDVRTRRKYESLLWADRNRRRPLFHEGMFEFALTAPPMPIPFQGDNSSIGTSSPRRKAK